jgi:hypothetical protein
MDEVDAPINGAGVDRYLIERSAFSPNAESDSQCPPAMPGNDNRREFRHLIQGYALYGVASMSNAG